MVGFYVFDVFSFDITANLMFVLLGLTGALWRLAPVDHLSSRLEPTLELALANE
jgi:hypothetical protein